MYTYTKLKSGNWGVKATTEIKAGDTVTVTKRDGSTKVETIECVVWSGQGVWLAAIAQRPQSTVRSRHRMGPGHGSAPSVRGYSSYCTANEWCRCFDCAS